MNIYDFSKTMKVFFCGGLSDDQESLLSKLQDGLKNGIETAVHPKEIERQERLNKRRFRRARDGGFSGAAVGTTPPSFISRGNGKYNDSVIFVSGGFGFGTKDDKFFDDMITKINELLSKNNSNLVFVRGCNDDPSYYTEKKFDFSNIVFAEDYSIVKLNGFDCLCIGGGVPIDRHWKMEQGKRLGRQLFFNGCNTVFNKDVIDDVISNSNITVIVSNDPPTFIPPYVDESRSSKWIENDKDIIRDITEQRLVIDSIYSELTKFNKKPYVWCYYSASDYNNSINNTSYTSSSSPYSMYDVNNICEEVFGHLLNGESGMGKKKKEILKKINYASNQIQRLDEGDRIVPFNPYDNAGRGINFDLPAIDGDEAIGTLDHPVDIDRPVERVNLAHRVEDMAARLRDAYDGMNVGVGDLQPVAINQARVEQVRAENDYTIQYALNNLAITTTDDGIPTITVADAAQGVVHE